ncbi:peptidoglycan D,D-transpeptidase FtsI family protein [Nocardioides insulae]|uniref:peptidoglycan D,D-transpeptidase FtsI family protein n=1 Tax=Nocardioides insulae TaxID=394734 RepID=UPI00041A8339|nr:penicillin-binding protein 2 [Nocardioides insulae]
MRQLRRDTASGRRTGRRGSPGLRLRIGFVVIAMVLSVFGARLVQLQGFDPHSYAAMAAAENLVDITLPAERGDILDRDGEPLADSVDGRMFLADPKLTSEQAPEIAKFLSNRLDIDYFATLTKLREDDSRFEYLARRVPATLAEDTLTEAREQGFDGLSVQRDPVRDYPAEDVASNLVGFLGTDEALAGFERTFDDYLSGTDGSASYEVGGVGGNRIPLGDSTRTEPVDGRDLRTTVDRDLQWFAQRTLRQAVQGANAESGVAIVMDSRTGEVLTVADDPTFDANYPSKAPKADRGSRALSDVYEPGSVQKVLTISALLDAGLVTPRTRLTVPNSYQSGDNAIHDWFEHDTMPWTLAGVVAQSSNIGTVLASNKFRDGQLYDYLTDFGLGTKTNVGVRGESTGVLPENGGWSPATEDRIDFGQSLSVNALQMTAAVNTIANGGVRVDPSLIQGSATTDEGTETGTDQTTEHRVVSEDAANGMMKMMERVVDPDTGTAAGAQVPGYRVAGKTGTAQRANPECGCYDGTFTVSFAGFAPAEDPRFTVYVAIQNPRNGGGGGSLAGPVFSKVMGFALQRYGVAPSTTKPSQLPVTWGRQR